MCGIAGALGLPLDLAAGVVERMRVALGHRGPDDHGTEVLRAPGFEHPVVLAHNRLSIIDLSSAGHGPMLRAGKRLALAYNGEIYNYAQVRTELEGRGSAFVSASDAEVLLAAYEAWGPECVARMRGMFAFAIADAGRGQVWLCRDRLGIKPLYVARPQPGGLLFASEVRALLAAGPTLVPPRASRKAIESFFAQGMVCGFDAIIASVAMVPPATSVVVDWSGKEIEQRKYWHLAFPTEGEEQGLDRDMAIAELRHELREAVRLHLIADVPVGIFLSGGVDSSAMATVASEIHRGGIHTVSVGFDRPEFDETAESAELARLLETEHTVLRLTGHEILDDIDQVFAAMDQPTVDGFNTYFVSRAARRAGLKVALSGLGGDELFGGYASFSDVPRAAALRRLLPFNVRLSDETVAVIDKHAGRRTAKILELLGRNPSIVATYLLRRELLLPVERRALQTVEWDEGLSGLDVPSGFDSFSARNQVSALELERYMRDMLLRDADVFSMAVSLELRVPLLDHVLLEKVVAMPGSWKAPDPRPKPLLLDAVGPRLPDSVAARAKRGFAFPWDEWLRGPMRERLRRAVGERECWRAVGILPDGPVHLWEAFDSSRASKGGLQVMALWALQQYVQRHGLTVE